MRKDWRIDSKEKEEKEERARRRGISKPSLLLHRLDFIRDRALTEMDVFSSSHLEEKGRRRERGEKGGGREEREGKGKMWFEVASPLSILSFPQRRFIRVLFIEYFHGIHQRGGREWSRMRCPEIF